MQATQQNQQGGFTLLEIMIALTVMAIGMFAVFSSIGTTVNMTKTVGEHELISEAMENRIEQIQAGIWERLPQTFMGTTPVLGVQTLPGRDDIITTELARWENTTSSYRPIADPRDQEGWGDLSEAEKDAEWSAIAPGDFDIILITLRADWQGVSGPMTSSMEFVLVDRDDVGN